MSCAIANAVMEVIDDERLQENAMLVGKYIIEQYNKMKNEFELIGDVRGYGLFCGIELVENRETRKPATNAATFVVNRMKNTHKILVSSDGPDENVIKIKPPMVFNMNNADEYIIGIRECLSYLESKEKAVNNTIVLPKTKIQDIQGKKDHTIKGI